MNTPGPESAELHQLKQELAAVREQMNDLRAQVKKIIDFFFVQAPDPERGLPEKVLIRCTDLTIFHRRENKHEEQMRLTSSDEGPFIRLYGRDEKARIELSAQNEGAQLELFSKDYAVAVQIKADEPSNRGSVSTFEAGKPRAAMQAGDGGGIVTVVHDDGRPRAFLAGGAASGELHLLNAETQAASVSLKSNPDGGGGIYVNDGSGTRQAIMAASPGGGQLLLNNDLGIQRVHLSSAADSAALTLNWGGTDAVILAAMETGGLLVLNDAAGNPAAELPAP